MRAKTEIKLSFYGQKSYPSSPLRETKAKGSPMDSRSKPWSSDIGSNPDLTFKLDGMMVHLMAEKITKTYKENQMGQVTQKKGI